MEWDLFDRAVAWCVARLRQGRVPPIDPATATTPLANGGRRGTVVGTRWHGGHGRRGLFVELVQVIWSRT